jgi:UDPglucose 6-dehydrogenase
VSIKCAIAVLTEWDEFVTYDWQKIYDSMQNQLLFFDGRNLLNGPLQEIGFVYQAIGS